VKRRDERSTGVSTGLVEACPRPRAYPRFGILPAAIARLGNSVWVKIRWRGLL